jgi:hypothetical protein
VGGKNIVDLGGERFMLKLPSLEPTNGQKCNEFYTWTDGMAGMSLREF